MVGRSEIRHTRRATLGILGAVGAVILDSGCQVRPPAATAPRVDPNYVGDPTGPGPATPLLRATGSPPVVVENARPGASGFRLTGHRFATDRGGEIAGYVHATSVAPGEELRFQVSAARPQRYRITIFRVGHYDGRGARQVAVSPWLDGYPQAAPTVDPATGAVRCGWRTQWRPTVAPDWTSGLYLALLASATGHHQWIPFVVRDPGHARGALVVLPTSTWQAYNCWPEDGRTGASLYYGFDSAGQITTKHRARAVSHDRPYAGNGVPALADHDIGFVQWVEGQGIDVAYATSEDLHTGRVDPARHRAVVFPGHDEYWSTPMREAVVTARDGGTSLVFLGANNCYWRIGYGADDHDDRLVRCAKEKTPASGPLPLGIMWRSAGHAEQQFIGAQYVSVVDGYAPLVVRGSRHWFWAGTGVRDGDLIPEVVWGEADQCMPGFAEPPAAERTLLAESPFRRDGAPQRQQSQLYRTTSGAWVFAAGSLGWTRALADPRLARATVNLLRRVVTGEAHTST
ncbi:N,N-dimethylformamidase beta subunit family domain-containing protein [Micromonospora sp. NPDC049004]|uniref:N,N-dimethylformamidase beta subunit family domain-containing protein n=1 Tax=Micromonospora sp. NPDC049004 TaxID=3154348 RepID=UPI003401F555